MGPVRVSRNIVPIGQLRAHAGRWLRHVADTGRSVVITRNGKPAGVLVSPEEFDRLHERERFLESVAAGLEDADAGRLMDTAELTRRLKVRRAAAARDDGD